MSKAWLDLATGPAVKVERFPNSAVGQAALVSQLLVVPTEEQPELLVVEATGGLERGVVAALGDPQLAVAVVNPRQVRELARCFGGRATVRTGLSMAARSAIRCNRRFGPSITTCWRPASSSRSPPSPASASS